MGARLMAIVAESERGRVFLSPTQTMEAVAREAQPEWKPEGALVERRTQLSRRPYTGSSNWATFLPHVNLWR